MSARWRYNLWLLVVARLVLPAVPGHRASPFNFVQLPAAAGQRAAPQRAVTPSRHAPLRAVPVTPLPAVPAPVPERRLSDQLYLASDHPRLVEPRLSGEALQAAASEVASATPAPLSVIAGVVEAEAPRQHVLPAQTDPAPSARPVSTWTVKPPKTSQASQRSAATAPAAPIPAPAPWFERVNWFAVLAIAWVAGLAFVVTRLAWVSLRLALAVRKLRPVTDPALLSLTRECARQLRMTRMPALLRAPDTFGPALVGLLRPRVLLPECVIGSDGGSGRHGRGAVGFDRHELRLILMHELAHMKRWDVAANWLLAALGAVHWFNPVLWLTFRRMRTDRELACDEMVLTATEAGAGRAYGPTILKLLQTLSRGRQPLPVPGVGMVGVLEGFNDGILQRFTHPKSSIRRRIAMIARFDRQQAKQRGASVLGISLTVLATGIALTGAVRTQGAAAADGGRKAVAAKATAKAAKPSPDNVMRLVALRRIDATKAAALATALLKQPAWPGDAPGANAASDERTNTLLLSGPAAAVESLVQVVQHLDASPAEAADAETRVFNLSRAKAAMLAPLIAMAGVEAATDERTNAVIVTGAPEAVNAVAAIVRKLDVDVIRDGVEKAAADDPAPEEAVEGAEKEAIDEAQTEARREAVEAANEVLNEARQQAEAAEQQFAEARQSAVERERETQEAAAEAERAVAEARQAAAERENEAQQAIEQARQAVGEARRTAEQQREEAKQSLEQARQELAEARERAKSEAADAEKDGNADDAKAKVKEAEQAEKEQLAEVDRSVKEAVAQGEEAIREAEQAMKETIKEQEQAVKEAHAEIEQAAAQHEEVAKAAAEASKEVAEAQQSAQQELESAQQALQSAQESLERAARRDAEKAADARPPEAEREPETTPAKAPATDDAVPEAPPTPEAPEQPVPPPGTVGPIAAAEAAEAPVAPATAANPAAPRPVRALTATAAPVALPTSPAAATDPAQPGGLAQGDEPAGPALAGPPRGGAAAATPVPRRRPGPPHGAAMGMAPAPRPAAQLPGAMPGMPAMPPMPGMGGMPGMPGAAMAGVQGMPGMAPRMAPGMMPPGMGGPVGAPGAARVEDDASRAADARTAGALQKAAPVDFNDIPLAEALDQLSDKAGVDIVTDWRALEAAGVNRDAPVTLRLRQNVPAEHVLAWVLRTAGGESIGFAIDRGVVLVSAQDQLDRMVVTRAYDLNPHDAAAGSGLEDLVRESISPNSWRQGGGIGSVRVFNNRLFVTTTERNHRQIERLLGLMNAQGIRPGDGAPKAPSQPGAFPGYPGDPGYGGSQRPGYPGGYPGQPGAPGGYPGYGPRPAPNPEPAPQRQ